MNDSRIARIVLERGKVNAIDPEIVNELRQQFRVAADDPNVRAVILTGAGKFFSFGFDIPHFLSYSREQFREFLVAFTSLYTEMFVFPKPVVAALNGHAVAGGCMLALAADVRVMAAGHGKISLNEITFGSSVFAGSAEMLRFAVGDVRASEVLYSGTMYAAEEAKEIGLVHEVADDAESRAQEIASELGGRNPAAFASLKTLLRRGVAEEMRRRESASIDEFVEIWYSPSTWANLQTITIR